LKKRWNSKIFRVFHIERGNKGRDVGKRSCFNEAYKYFFLFI
jgi:hypothetical protein